MSWYQEPKYGDFEKDVEYWQNHHRRRALHKAIELVNNFADCTSILDVGCRSLGALCMVNGRYTRKAAIDIYRPAFFGISRSYDFIHGDFLEAKIGEFDVVLCLETIEHIEPCKRLDFCSKLLKTAQKHLIVSIPYMWKGSKEPIPHDGYNERHIAEWFPNEDPVIEIIGGHLLASFER